MIFKAKFLGKHTANGTYPLMEVVENDVLTGGCFACANPDNIHPRFGKIYDIDADPNDQFCKILSPPNLKQTIAEAKPYEDLLGQTVSCFMDMMDGVREHDIHAQTGLPETRCKEIYATYQKLCKEMGR